MTIAQESLSPAVEAATTTTVKHWINGAETEGSTGRTQPIYNPSTGEITAQLALGAVTTLAAAVRAAPLAQRAWGLTPLAHRTERGATHTGAGALRDEGMDAVWLVHGRP